MLGAIVRSGPVRVFRAASLVQRGGFDGPPNPSDRIFDVRRVLGRGVGAVHSAVPPFQPDCTCTGPGRALRLWVQWVLRHRSADPIRLHLQLRWHLHWWMWLLPVESELRCELWLQPNSVLDHQPQQWHVFASRCMHLLLSRTTDIVAAPQHAPIVEFSIIDAAGSDSPRRKRRRGVTNADVASKTGTSKRSLHPGRVGFLDAANSCRIARGSLPTRSPLGVGEARAR